MARWIKHLRCLKRSSSHDDESADLPAAAGIAECEQETEECKGAQPLQSYREASWMRPVLNRTNRHEYERDKKQPREGTGKFGRRSQMVRLGAQISAHAITEPAQFVKVSITRRQELGLNLRGELRLAMEPSKVSPGPFCVLNSEFERIF
jgi:hypothetical protein